MTRFKVEELLFNAVVGGFHVGLVVFLSRRDKTMAGAQEFPRHVGEASVVVSPSFSAGELRPVVGLDDAAVPQGEADAGQVGADGGDKAAGVGLAQFVGEPEEQTACFDVSPGVLEARQIGVAPHLLDVEGDVIEVLDVDLVFLEWVEPGLGLAHIAFLLILLFAPSGQVVLAQNPADGADAGGNLTEILEPVGAETGGLLAGL